MACLVCAADNLVDLGPIFHDQPACIAGVEAKLGTEMFRLLGCPECGVNQKYPFIPAEELERCYAAASDDNWGNTIDHKARQTDLFADTLNRHVPGGHLLDIGCSNGAILSCFDDRWKKYGVEPSVAASRLAAARGINILGQTINDLTLVVDQFDAVMAIDLVEHLSNPMQFFAKVRGMLRQGGVFLVFTGDTDAATWSRFGSSHWYCGLPEHVVFFNAKSIRWIAHRTGFKVSEVQRRPHLRMPFLTRTNQAIRVAIWCGVRRFKGFGIERLRRWSTRRRSPYWSTASDHMLVALTAI